MQELHAIFHGEVQGVGFRATTKRLAQNLGLVGFVRNLSDGSVEMVAQGTEANLKKLLFQLHQKFEIAETVENFSQPSKNTQSFKLFRSGYLPFSHSLTMMLSTKGGLV